MKKQIILEEYDYNTLKENSDLWIKKKVENTKYVRFDIWFNKIFTVRNFELDEDIPENLKDYLEKFILDMKFQMASMREEDSEIKRLKAELNGVPNWIKSIFK